jgi:hypothetical protein
VFDVSVPDNISGGPASIFSVSDVKIHYDDVRGHLVSADFSFTAVPEPVTLPVVFAGLLAIGLAKRRLMA